MSVIIISAIIIVGFIVQIRLMQSPKTALLGNRIGAIFMAVAVLYTIIAYGGIGNPSLWLWLIVGGAAGVWLGQIVKMIQMPQMVGVLNGFGGAASALVAVAGSVQYPENAVWYLWLTASLALAVGMLTFTGSLVAAMKLQGMISGRPVRVDKNGQSQKGLLIAGAAVILFSIIFTGVFNLWLVLLAIVSGIYGVIMALRVGGADMPVVISLLNSFSGIAASITGFAVEDPLLVGVGAIVGVSGLILTRIMCKAMNRSLSAVLTGITTVMAQARQESPVRPQSPSIDLPKVAENKTGLSAVVGNARRVIIVPGYGMAVAQAQDKVKELIDKLEQSGKEVKIGIHPVAGRMPGHMNVLLAEVGIDYDKLYDMETINPEFEKTDLTIVVGACDVVNPSANTAEDTPIYGMPILEVDKSRHIIVCNLDEKPGYSGVENSLYSMENVTTIWGNASETVPTITRLLEKTPDEEERVGKAGSKALESVVKSARRVIIVPGYGMAVAQAQDKVKELIDKLEQSGKEVKIGIHPVAGRMPGHMNVLLAEVGIDYDKLYDMETINPEFEKTDLTIVVGACDVVNPSANTAEDTPIYGMPILEVDKSRHIIVCNLDEKPGYSGVENSLYSMENVTTIWGNASETVPIITRACN
ncbi:MAG TPA: NAD(P)(+) transhydrogenase (Re/Si-specific) subunit beta [Mesotoga sp.]|nr:NAD(P)(+) transhydrogenase (Re/Si-specific) subunit beta [Mesotoga sp.]HPX22890.1 NAD(P)(+) transhydrogenase (Re/Si-specific) subunit beta [Mesotoga sp.]HQC56510.1 NAD(P)(+) transhydrogenase (Re/Si-specific) subunit beta [Mesotoga sp.]